jgi:ATP-grasp domain, R2K clade family 3
MNPIFCSDPLEPRKPDSAYQREVAAADQLRLERDLIDFEALVNDQDAPKAVRKVRQAASPTLGIYRGWMLKPIQYQLLYDALTSRNIFLINDPASYVHVHYLPESYSIIRDYTPRSVWLPLSGDISLDAIMEMLRRFGSSALIVKDYVKSQKHYWEEACFIPSASDRAQVERVVRRFVELQRQDLNEGLVFREFVDFEPLT